MGTCGSVMTRNPVYCVPTDSAIHAAQLMRDHDVGPVPVVESHESQKVVGIVTDRDLALKIVAAGRDGSTTLQEVMTRAPAICRATDTVQSALDEMTDNQVRRVPVVDNEDRLVGIISQADVATRVAVPRKTADVVARVSRPADS